MEKKYVHGYSPREEKRLLDQAQTLTDLLHCDTRYPAKSRVLEAGCGVGAQTVPLAQNSPEAQITSIDLSLTSLAQARERANAAGIRNVRFRQADIYALPFPDGHFDGVILSEILEHIEDDVAGLCEVCATPPTFPLEASRPAG